MFLNQENRNRKQDTVFAPFSSKNNVFFILRKKECKKEKQCSKDEAKKKRRDIQNEKSFFKTQKKPNTEKIN